MVTALHLVRPRALMLRTSGLTSLRSLCFVMGLIVWASYASRTGSVLKKMVPDFRNGHRALLRPTVDFGVNPICSHFTQITVLFDEFDSVVLPASRTGPVLNKTVLDFRYGHC